MVVLDFRPPAMFRDPNSSVGAPGPGGGKCWFAGGGGGGSQDPAAGDGGGPGGPYAGGDGKVLLILVMAIMD